MIRATLIIDILVPVMLFALAMGVLNGFYIGALVEPNKIILASEISLLVFCASLGIVSLIMAVKKHH